MIVPRFPGSEIWSKYTIGKSGFNLLCRGIAASANITEMDEEAKKYPIITNVEKNVNLNSIMSNSFGFGGTNATLVFEKV